MKITEIEAFNLKYDVEYPYGMSRGLVSSRGSTIIIVKTDEGIVGFGETWGGGTPSLEHIKQVSSLYIGQDPFDRDILFKKCMDSLYHLGHGGLHIAALSGIDLALWDIIGKACNQSVSKLLGGQSRNKIMAYASTGYLSETSSLKELSDQIENAMELGFKAVKIKIGKSPESDRERVKLTRQITGEGVLILVDANGNYKRDSAYKSARLIEEYDIHWYEEPVSPEDIEGFRYLKEQTSIPLASGEALFTRYGFRNYIERGLIDFVQPDLSKCGGFTEALAITTLAQTYNLNVSAHVWGTAVGVAAATQFMAYLPIHPHTMNEPAPILFEYDTSKNPLRTGIINENIIVRNGFIEVSEGSGLGVTLNTELINKYAAEGTVLAF
ncbi:mandelate racemase/muconate lactonizing enzyme family protein [Schinkia azotoformans]|uniref:Mandelate racemase/muconate lactonizing protein n=1 Tax=Schinkia azotoformans LMG 9581 TaxID=1131731 RepID=K6DRN6_SCHAZ|nr:mandelate racemase/muconate lactonizing enzyme family protein [Schinkia azotoformans]EKN63446.1 Mandelate racemase/muconate lactonizing protein [Schinkia azotoformans LMG 9581]MEC1638745.1 mandelate racemase/muconate lactonizing enzyme family protein [Schinkia azotoformans]MEC1946710.1 mandelate racemase/muconate lactonizing enzyme family protein [Schinkia azotoformans]